MPNSRSLSVQSKLIAAFVALTLMAIAVMSWIGYASARLPVSYNPPPMSSLQIWG